MVSSYEFKKIKLKNLPKEWQSKEILNELERFLQGNWEQRKIFFEDGQITSRQQFIDFDKKDGIKLQNYIGTIVFKGGQLNIFPKIYKEEEDDDDTEHLKEKDLFSDLIAWLGYCDNLNFPFIKMKNSLEGVEDLKELLISVYARYVQKEIERQPYYCYEELTEEGTFVKGKININNYILRKYPTAQTDRMEYTYSGFVIDNLLNRVIKYTCNVLIGLTNQESNKAILRKILFSLGNVSLIHCMPCDCDKIYLDKLHEHYNVIVSMSKMFLLNQANTNQIGGINNFCFLFPAEMLFEGFVGGFLKEMLRDVAKVSTQASDQYLAELVVDGESYGNAFRLREDILIDNDDFIVVADTKYKEIDSFEKIRENKKLKISDNDIKQMAIYASKRSAKKMYLIYPLHRNEKLENTEVQYNILVSGEEKKIPLEILKVPFSFGDDPAETKENLKTIFSKISATDP